MKIKPKKNKAITRIFTSEAPDWINPIYDIVQEALDSVLQNKEYAHKIVNLQLTRTVNGKKYLLFYSVLWKNIQAIIGNPLKGKINNASWYNRILMSNLITLAFSRQAQIKEYQLLKENNFKINKTLRDALTKEGLFPSNTELQDLVTEKEIPEMPEHIPLKLNYAFSDKQMFYLDNNFNCYIHIISYEKARKIGVSGWKQFQIYIPTYIRRKNLIKICKPFFIYSKKYGKIICQIPYQVLAEDHSGFKNILGIDLGRKKFYSGTVLYRNGHYSPEYVPSNQLNHLNLQLAHLNRHIKRVYKKINRSKNYYNLDPNKQKLRYLDYRNSREKRTRLKKQIEWLIAEEITDIAYKHQCKEIHLENLTWVNNLAGKWDFSSIAQHIKCVAELKGIKVILVSAKNTSKEHPVTKELGKEVGRDIVFKNGQRIDRDQLAGLNIALRKSKLKVKELHKRKTVQTHRKSRRRENLLLKKQNFKKVKDTQIVVFLYDIAKNNLALVLRNKNICYLNNNLAKRNVLKIDQNSLNSIIIN